MTDSGLLAASGIRPPCIVAIACSLRRLRGFLSFEPSGRPSAFPGVTEYAGFIARVRSAGVSLSHLARAARLQISLRVSPGCLRVRPKSFLLYHALFC